MVIENIIGVMYLDTSDPLGRFDEGHLQLLMAIGGIAAVSLENAQQMERLEGENSRLRSSLAIEAGLTNDSDPEWGGVALTQVDSHESRACLP